MANHRAEFYGAMERLEINSPIQSLYRLHAGEATRLIFGRFVSVEGDRDLGSPDLLKEAHVQQAIQTGRLQVMDPALGTPAFHMVKQWMAHVTLDEERALVKGRGAHGALNRMPDLALCCLVKHEIPRIELTYYSVERGLFRMPHTVVSPVCFTFEEEIAAVKKYASINTHWADQATAKGLSLVNFTAPPHWALAKSSSHLHGGKATPSPYLFLQDWAHDRDLLRLEEIKRLENKPLEDMGLEQFAQLFNQFSND